MGFMDVLNKGLEQAKESSEKRMKEFETYKMRYEHFDDEKLKALFKQTSGYKKLAIGALLKERGY